MRFRIALLVPLTLLLAGCLPTAPAEYAPPSVEATIVTPSTAFTYAFVMVNNDRVWWVQIGAKSDADGIHVAVQAWRTLVGNYFAEFDELTPGTPHRYRIDWTAGGWRLWFDGKVMTTQNPGQCPPCSTEINFGERTTA